MEEMKMGPFHWVLLVLFVVVLGALSFKSAPTSPHMPGVNTPEAVRPIVESTSPAAPALTPPVESQQAVEPTDASNH